VTRKDGGYGNIGCGGNNGKQEKQKLSEWS